MIGSSLSSGLTAPATILAAIASSGQTASHASAFLDSPSTPRCIHGLDALIVATEPRMSLKVAFTMDIIVACSRTVQVLAVLPRMSSKAGLFSPVH